MQSLGFAFVITTGFKLERMGSLHNSGGNAWNPNDRKVSAVSALSTSVFRPSLYIRGPHQLLHMYIGGRVAKQRSGRTDVSPYKATHSLGTYDKGEGCRSVMADLSIRSHLAESGNCSGEDNDPIGNTPQDVNDIYFSECTHEALFMSSYYKQHDL